MAGWLAWNLRILSSALIACCSYYGINYLNSQNGQKNIEKINFQNQEESDEVENLKLGDKRIDVATKYFKKISSDNKVSEKTILSLIEKKNKECEEKPYLHINSSNLANRRYCRLYWSVKDSVDILIKTENKFILLSSENSDDDAGWKVGWDKYTSNKNPWGDIAEEIGKAVPDKFKSLCKEKAKELIYSENDNLYENVRTFCTRRKTVKDVVLGKGKLRLLKTGGNDENIWENKLTEYKKENNSEKFYEKPPIEDKDSLKRECEKAIKVETMVVKYKRSLSVVERYCATNK